MTVRGLVCVYYKGRFAFAKKTTRGYPQETGEGMEVLRFLWQPGNIERLREGFQYVVTPTPEGWEQIRETPGLRKSTDAKRLNNIAQATADNYAIIRLELDSATSGWCDWAYIVDLDRNTFDVFGCEEKKREAPIPTRFSDLGGNGDHVTIPALLQSFPFSQLPATEEEFNRALEAWMKEGSDYRGYYYK
ncbi:hypothetical protein V8E54_010070 [Elaphomyces granulatus]